MGVCTETGREDSINSGRATNQVQGIKVADPNSSVGSIDVTSPGTGAALGLSPANQAIAARIRSPLSVPKEQYGELFNR